MGGRKGYPLKSIVGDTRKIVEGKKQLLQGIKEEDHKKVVQATSRILAKSDSVLDALAHSFLFVGNLKKDYKNLSKEDVKARRKQLAKKWANYRKDKGKKFDAVTNRSVVDSATKILGGKK